MKNRPGLTANQLKGIAMGLMLLDHTWATLLLSQTWMNCLGRAGFPIFAFLIAEGYYHTHDYGKYKKRLLVLALISEIPFNLMYTGSWIFPFHQNVVFTLLFGLMAVHAMERFRTTKKIWWLPIMVAYLYLPKFLFADYGEVGAFIVLMFAVLRKPDWRFRLAQAVILFLVCQFGIQGYVYLVGPFEITRESFSLLALPLLWLYNGQLGKKSKAIQMGWYSFYPVHMLVLALLYRIL